MLLDSSYANLILENIGSTIDNLLLMSNAVTTNNYSLVYDFFSNYISLLHI